MCVILCISNFFRSFFYVCITDIWLLFSFSSFFRLHYVFSTSCWIPFQYFRSTDYTSYFLQGCHVVPYWIWYFNHYVSSFISVNKDYYHCVKAFFLLIKNLFVKAIQLDVEWLFLHFLQFHCIVTKFYWVIALTALNVAYEGGKSEHISITM